MESQHDFGVVSENLVSRIMTLSRATSVQIRFWNSIIPYDSRNLSMTVIGALRGPTRPRREKKDTYDDQVTMDGVETLVLSLTQTSFGVKIKCRVRETGHFIFMKIQKKYQNTFKRSSIRYKEVTHRTGESPTMLARRSKSRRQNSDGTRYKTRSGTSPFLWSR